MADMVSTDTTKKGISSGAGAHVLPNIVVFSKDRAMQLDLFLRSFARFVVGADRHVVHVLHTGSNSDFQRGYEKLAASGLSPNIRLILETNFKVDLLRCIDPAIPHTVFFVDDDVFTRSFDFDGESMDVFRRDDDILCYSLRLHPHLTFNYTQQREITPPAFLEHRTFRWKGLEGDYGYPMSLDGHLFRTGDILPLLEMLDYRNPNTLEAILARVPPNRPKMICDEYGAIVNVPANRVQTVFANGHAGLGADGLNAQFLAGKMIDVDPFEGVRTISCHQELPLSLIDDPRAEAAGRREVVPPKAVDPGGEVEPRSSVQGGGPKVSIIICARNVEAFIRESLESAVGQTLRDIEIICVDNHSSDSTLAILEEFQRRDGRIRLIANPEDYGLLRSRKAGVLAATGEYIQFLDADDSLEVKACETSYRQIREQGVEILHFGARVDNVGGLPEGQIAKLDKFIAPYPGRLEGADVFRACFREDKYRFTLWNKLIDADLCKRAVRELPESFFILAEDLFSYFIIAFFARSYFGLDAPPLYRYRFGSGITGQKELTLAQFEGLCAQAQVVRGLQRFLEEQGGWAEYWPEQENISRHLAEGCASSWLTQLREADRAGGFDQMVASWGMVDALAALAKVGWDRRTNIARWIRGAHALACRKTSVRTIGTYYNRMRNGGVERVLSRLIPLWMGAGYDVVLFTDESPHADDYPLPAGVKRVVLATAGEARTGHFRFRAEQWGRVLAENRIDAMVYHDWIDSILLPDLLAVKCLGIPFVIYAHGIFSFLLLRHPEIFAALPEVFSLCDAVIGLSRIDKAFWESFAPRTRYFPNPPVFDLEEVRCAELNGLDVVWVGRISREKNPLDAIQIMARVVQRVPAARLFMIGKGQDEKLDAQIVEEVQRLELREHVVLCGYHHDVGRFYEQASIFLSTSSFEGFSMTLAEAKAYGLPCVMYDLPHLEMVRDGLGVSSVAQRDITAAATAIVTLLEDGEKRRELGRAARHSMENFSRYDLAAGWREVLEVVVSGKPAPGPATEEEKTTGILLRTLLAHFQRGRDAARLAECSRTEWTAKVTGQRNEARKRIEHLTARIEELTRQRDVRQERVERLMKQVEASRNDKDVQATIGRLKKQIKDLKARYEKSLSWRVTAPMRWLSRRAGYGEGRQM